MNHAVTSSGPDSFTKMRNSQIRLKRERVVAIRQIHDGLFQRFQKRQQVSHFLRGKVRSQASWHQRLCLHAS